MTSVIEQVHSQSAGGAGANVTLSTTPAGGDKVYVAILGNRATPRTITAISGLGATWTEVHNSGTSRYVVYEGTGATTSGTVTITLSGTQNTATSLWLVRGLTASTIVASFTTASTSTTLAGPSQSAGNGQAVLATAMTTINTTTFPSAQTPSGAYTAATGGTFSNSAYALPTSTANHQATAGIGSSGTLYVGQATIGDVVATIPEVNGALTGSGALSATVVEVESAAANLTGSGVLSAAVVAVAFTAASLAGSGALSASVVPVAAVDAALDGSGTLSADVFLVGGIPEVNASLAGTGELSASVVPVSAVSASLAGSGILDASVAPVGLVSADLTGSGVLSADIDTSSGTPIDLSTFFDLYASTTWDGTALTGFYFAFPLVVDPGTTYTVEIDYTVTSGSGFVSIHSALGPTDEAVDASSFATLDEETGLAGAGTSTLTIGPGVGGWDAAMALDEIWPVFLVANVAITAIRVSPAFLVGDYTPPGPPGTDLTRAGGRTRSGYAVATWEPAVVEPPSPSAVEHRRIRGAAFGAVTMVGAQPTYTVSEATTPRLRTRIIVGGKDVSFFRDIPTPEPEYQLAEPLLWGPATIELPQVAAAFETAGVGDLSWCAKGKPVVLQRVTDEGVIVAKDYRGVVISHDTSGRTLRLEIGGHAQGKAALRHKPLPIFRDTLDMGRLAWAAVRDLGLRFSPRLGPTTGIKQALFGGSDYLTYISELCAKAFDLEGQWSLMPDDDGLYSFARKDTSTVHWTLFNDDARVVADLRSDAAEEENRMFATGVTPKGQRVRFGVYPGLEPGPAAPYPFIDESPFGVGTLDAETDTGDGVTVMVKRLWTAGYLSLEDATGLYDAEVTRAIMSLQTDSGLTVTGNMNPNTWDALFDVATTGYTLRGSRIEPAAQDYRVRRYNRSSSGAIIGKNPNFDRSRLIVDREIDFGSGFTRHQMREFARNEVNRGQSNWHGTVTIHQGAILRGDITPGAMIDTDDLADVREIRPGQNVSLPQFAGGTLLHISGVEITRTDGGHPVARLTVDTRARDALAVWEMIRRNKETRRDPARRWKGNRASGVVKDSIDVWDEIGGVVAGDRDLVAGWNIVEVVGGQEGTVSRIRLRVSAEAGVEGDGVEFACAVFGKQITAARLNGLVPAPLAAYNPASDDEEGEDDEDTPPSPLSGDRAWEKKAVRKVLNKKKQVYSAGTNLEPCGYSPGRKRGTVLPTGKHEDDAGFSYRTDREPILYLAVWVASAAVLEGGRVMWPQLEAGA